MKNRDEQSDRRERLRVKVERLVEVSTVPAVFKRIVEVVDNAGSSISDLEDVLKHDQSISGKVVGMANSAFYGQGRKVDSISRAILLLGFDMVKCIAISASIFSSRGRENKYMNALWQHSFEVAIAASVLAEKSRNSHYIEKESAFFSGLVHDIGRAIMVQLSGRTYIEILERTGEDIVREEIDLFGASHAEVGAWFAERFLMPKKIVYAIEFHHHPEVEGLLQVGNTLCKIVYLSDFMASSEDSGHGDFFISPSHQQILSEFDLGKDPLNEIADAFYKAKSGL